MKLSEAITLGHTLIAERWTEWYSPDPVPCGCAVGSAYAAVTDGSVSLSDGLGWLHEHWPWTRQEAPAGILRHTGEISPGSVAAAISAMHVHGIPRLKIAEIVAQIEPQGPEGEYLGSVAETKRSAVHSPASALK